MNKVVIAGTSFVLGVLGSGFFKTAQAREACVKATAYGLSAVHGVETALEQAKAEAQDIVAEAEALNRAKEAEQKGQEEKPRASEEDDPSGKNSQ